MFSTRTHAFARHLKQSDIHLTFQAYTNRYAEGKRNVHSPMRFMLALLSGSDSHGLKSPRIARIFRESSFLVCLRRGGARDHGRSLSWITCIASAGVVTLGSANEARTCGVQHSEQWPLAVSTCALPVVRMLRFPVLKSLALTPVPVSFQRISAAPPPLVQGG